MNWLARAWQGLWAWLQGVNAALVAPPPATPVPITVMYKGRLDYLVGQHVLAEFGGDGRWYCYYVHRTDPFFPDVAVLVSFLDEFGQPLPHVLQLLLPLDPVAHGVCLKIIDLPAPRRIYR